MSYHITDGEAFHALHYNRLSKRHDGWGVYDLPAGNLKVSINTGNLGTGTDTLTVQGGDAVLGGTDTNIATQSVSIPQADTAPRKDVVVVYGDGTVGREAGAPEPKAPATRPLTLSERPAPPDLSTVDCVPLAIIHVLEGATAITASEIVDVRPPAFVGGGGGGGTAASITGRYPETGTITADGTASSFTWTVESPATLSMALADAATSDASTDFSVTVDDAANTITVSYATAPTGELAWNWAANLSITEVETATHGAASHDPSVADQADLDAHTTNVSNPHTTTAEQTRLAGNTVEGTLRSALGADAYRELVDSSSGTVTDPYTLRFHGRDWRLVAAGVGGIGNAVHVDHDSGDVTLGGGITANGNGYITGDLTVDGNIAGTVQQEDLVTKADKDGGGTGTLTNYDDINSEEVNNIEFLGGPGHSTLASAVAALPPAGGEIHLVGTVVETADVTIGKPVKIVGAGFPYSQDAAAYIDLNGYTLHVTSQGQTWEKLQVKNGNVIIGEHNTYGGRHHIELGVRASPGDSIEFRGGFMDCYFDIKSHQSAARGIVWNLDSAGIDYFNQNTVHLLVHSATAESVVMTGFGTGMNEIEGNDFPRFEVEGGASTGFVVDNHISLKSNKFFGYGVHDGGVNIQPNEYNGNIIWWAVLRGGGTANIGGIVHSKDAAHLRPLTTDVNTRVQFSGTTSFIESGGETRGEQWSHPSLGQMEDTYNGLLVSTAAVSLGDIQRSASLTIHGESSTDGTVTFIDRVDAIAFGPHTRVSSTERNAPAARTYATTAAGGIEVSVAAGEYEVHVEKFKSGQK